MKRYIILLLILTAAECKPDWVQLYSGNFNSVHFINADTGMACGYSGNIIKTTNGGLNWTVLNSGTSYKLNEIKYFSPDTAIAAGDNQIIIRTTNGGLNWTTVVNPAANNYSIQDLSVFSNGKAIGNSISFIYPYEYYFLYKTANYGETWQIQQVYVPASGMHFIDMNNGWAYGSHYIGPPINTYYLEVNKTSNGGNNWTEIYSSSGISINAGMIYFYNNYIGVKYSHIGTLYLSGSNDGGYSWNNGSLVLNQGHMINSIFFVNASNGWIAGDNGTIYHTSNSGLNWYQQQSPVFAHLQDVFFLNNNTGFIACTGGGILKTTNGGISTGLSQINNEAPQSSELFQNYPNPFNPVTIIRYNLSLPLGNKGASVFVTLKVYDVLGNEVTTLVSEKQSPGTYKAEFNGRGLPSGVYFYKLTENENAYVRKMLLIE